MDQIPVHTVSLYSQTGAVKKDGHELTLPRYEIATTEALRLWQYFIGLPVSERTWKFERPSLDEL